VSEELNLKTAFAYLVTGAVLFQTWAKEVIGFFATFDITGIGVNFIVSTAIWILGVGYFVAGLWYFAIEALRLLNRYARKLM
jgi:hypothetical protein